MKLCTLTRCKEIEPCTYSVAMAHQSNHSLHRRSFEFIQEMLLNNVLETSSIAPCHLRLGLFVLHYARVTELIGDQICRLTSQVTLKLLCLKVSQGTMLEWALTTSFIPGNARGFYCDTRVKQDGIGYILSKLMLEVCSCLKCPEMG